MKYSNFIAHVAVSFTDHFLVPFFIFYSNKNNIFKTLNKLNFCIILKQLLYITDNIKTYHRLKNVNNLANEKF